MKKRIIAFGGPKGSGKDTISQILGIQNATHPNTFKRHPFAGDAETPRGVKGIANLVFGYTQDQVEDALLKETATENWPYLMPRVPIMDIANWLRDEYGGDIWVRAAERTMDPLYKCHFMTDWRFPEESEWLERREALTFYIQRDKAEERLTAAQKASDSMALNQSESHYAQLKREATYILDNNGLPHQARNELLSIIRKEMGFWGDWK